MATFYARSFRITFASLLLATLLMLAPPHEAQAQIVFDVQLSERGQEMVTDPDRMAPQDLAQIVGEHGIIIFRGERPIEGRFLAFFLPREGEEVQRVDFGRFELEPGEHHIGRIFPEREFLALFERLFEGNTFFSDSYYFSDSHFFPCSIFDPEGREYAAKELVFDGIEEGRIGFALAVHPEHGDIDREEVQIRPMRFDLSAR